MPARNCWRTSRAPLLTLPSRWLTDPILGRDQQFSIPLIGREPYNEHYGDLRITLDTAPRPVRTAAPSAPATP